MSTFLKFVVTLIVNMIWQKSGGKGAVPPVRLPRSGKHVNIPTLGSWQMMAAMWVAKKFWEQYGRNVKTHLMDMPHPVPRRVGTWLPDAPDKNGTQTAAATPPAPVAAAPTAAAPAPVPAPAPTPAANYGTQRLNDNPDAAQGSLLNSLRPASSS